MAKRIVLIEMEWALRAAYGLPETCIRKSIFHVLGLPNVRAEDPEQLAVALDHYAKGLDFAGALHLAASSTAEAFHTFEREFTRRARALGALVESI